jgi:hypothetical protein
MGASPLRQKMGTMTSSLSAESLNPNSARLIANRLKAKTIESDHIKKEQYIVPLMKFF